MSPVRRSAAKGRFWVQDGQGPLAFDPLPGLTPAACAVQRARWAKMLWRGLVGGKRAVTQVLDLHSSCPHAEILRASNRNMRRLQHLAVNLHPAPSYTMPLGRPWSARAKLPLCVPVCVCVCVRAPTPQPPLQRPVRTIRIGTAAAWRLPPPTPAPPRGSYRSRRCMP